MNFDEIIIKEAGHGMGMSAFGSNEYLGTYNSIHALVLDLVYRWRVDDVEKLLSKWHIAYDPNNATIEPYKYRGVCSEIFWPLDQVYRYIYFANSLSEIFSNFECHEYRAQKRSDIFSYGPQGTGVHLFNENTLKYEFWVGGKDLHTVTDVMREVKRQGLEIPLSLQQEYDELGRYDVFICHKSEDYKIAKVVYENLTSKGYKVFMSEITLPAFANADYTAELDIALENSSHLVVIADSSDKISSGWVRYEWSSFLNEKLSGRKEGNIITVMTNNINLDELPFSLRQFEAIKISEVDQLHKWLPDIY